MAKIAASGRLGQYAVEINRVAHAGIDPKEVAICASVLQRMSVNLQKALVDIPERSAKDPIDLSG